MSVYVDPIINYPGQGDWCHMMADTLDELHTMATRIGLRRAWFQNHPDHPHYDLRTSKREKAIAAGASQITSREMVMKAREIKQKTKGER